MSEGTRICPICDHITDEGVCPQDNVPTVDRARLLKYRDGLEPGSVIAGRFRVDRFIGAGAMGGVYLCTQLNMQRPVALKTLKPEFMSDQPMLKRFYLEARAASQLSHPNIVRIYDFGVDEDLEIAYIAMEYLEGDDLQDLLARRERLNERDACGLLAQVSKALVGAHDKGIVHRDLKPGNIHVRELPGGDIQAKVLDFGIAKVLPANMDMTSGLTDTGMTLGTPHYMSPEQVSGRSVDYRSDFYAVGCMLYEMLAGSRPFVAEDRLGLSMMHLTEPPPLLPDALTDGASPSEPLRDLYQRLMAKKAEDRPQSTDALGRALSALAQGEIPDLEPLGHAPVRMESSDVSV
ncbi:MAG: serine/threonine-protein kinase, partial [Myxococcota bacterium]|nr:serine/threonine-protein kinase [Myxococcota bacterium]